MSRSSKEATGQQSSPVVARRKTKFRLLDIAFSIVIIIVISVGTIWLLVGNRSLVDQRLLREVDFPLYLPKKAPEGYQIDPQLTTVSGRVVSYAFVNSATNSSITVTVQPIPGQFKMSQLTDGGSVSSFAVSSGMLYDLSTEDSHKFLLDTGDTLVFLTSTKPIDIGSVKLIAENLTRVN